MYFLKRLEHLSPEIGAGLLRQGSPLAIKQDFWLRGGMRQYFRKSLKSSRKEIIPKDWEMMLAGIILGMGVM